MRKIWTIIQREYWTRARSKAFILGTLLMPIGMAVLFAIPFLAASTVEKERVKIYLKDDSGEILRQVRSDEYFLFAATSESWDSMKGKLTEGEVYILLPSEVTDSAAWGEKAKAITLPMLVREPLTIQVKSGIESRLRDALEHQRMNAIGITEEQIKSADVHFSLTEENTEGKKSNAEIATITGYVMSMLIYILTLVYGMYVMRGVIEEKTSRILEVVASSVKPFQLMMGKLIGICLLGLTQFALWIILSTIFTSIIAALVANPAEMASTVQNMQNMPGMQGGGAAAMASMDPASAAGQVELILQVLSAKNILLFIFYFLGGFFLYGSLFAAVGSAVDQESDAQQFTFPVMIPIIIPILLIGNVLQNPNGTLAVFLSIFPFSSPTIMMVRITSTDVPWYELAASMVALVVGFIATVWLAGRIYRVGILMYGKKPTFRELGKWMFRS